MFIVNACVDRRTPAEKCVGFYATLLKAGVKAELHVFSKGSHGFAMGTGAGKSAALCPVFRRLE
jgi:dienelactone hydrolase